jgi:hypothetical protein
MPGIADLALTIRSTCERAGDVSCRRARAEALQNLAPRSASSLGEGDQVKRLLAEPAAESVRDLDHDTIRIYDVRRPAAGIVNGAFERKAKGTNAINCLVYVIDDEPDVIDMDAFRLKPPVGTRLAKTEVEAVWSANYAPPPPGATALFLDLKSKKRRVESYRNIQIADAHVNVIHASCVHWCARTQSGARFAGLEIDESWFVRRTQRFVFI